MLLKQQNQHSVLIHQLYLNFHQIHHSIYLDTLFQQLVKFYQLFIYNLLKTVIFLINLQKQAEKVINININCITISIDVLDHYRIEVLETDAPISITICFLQHQNQRLLIQIFFEMVIHFLQILNRNVVFILSVVFFEDRGDQLFIFVAIWLYIHRLHKLDEAYSSCFFRVKLRNRFVSSLSVGIEPILRKQEFDVIGQQYSYSGRLIGIEHLFEVDHILDSQVTCDVKLRFKLSQIFSLKTYSVDALTFNGTRTISAPKSTALSW